MEKNNGKILAVAALVVAVVALSVGFAAYSASLTIDSNATLKATDTFSSNVKYDETSPKCYVTGDGSKTSVATAGYSVGTAANHTWSGISVPLTMDNKSVTCEAVVNNTSDYIAYLTGISTNTGITCESVATGDAAASNVDTICGNTKATVTIGSDSLAITSAAASASNTTGTIAATNGTQTVTLVIEYTGTVAADGDIRIKVPNITYTYKTTR